jgi:hypothetical protein
VRRRSSAASRRSKRGRDHRQVERQAVRREAVEHRVEPVVVPADVVVAEEDVGERVAGVARGADGVERVHER